MKKNEKKRNIFESDIYFGFHLSLLNRPFAGFKLLAKEFTTSELARKIIVTFYSKITVLQHWHRLVNAKCWNLNRFWWTQN